MINFDD